MNFETDKRETFDILNRVKRKAREEKATIHWDSAIPDMNALYDSRSNPRWAETFAPLIKGVVSDAAGHWVTETGVEVGTTFNIHNLETQDWFNTTALKFATPISQTSKDEIAGLLQLGEAEGWTITTMQNAMTDLFNQWVHGNTDAAGFAGERLPPYRTEMIARTVSMQAYNAGSTALFDDAGVEQQEWLATNDDRTRETHAAANGQVVVVGEPFDVGGSQMLFPGDDSLGADVGEIVNCRCTVLPIIPEGGLVSRFGTDATGLHDEEMVVEVGTASGEPAAGMFVPDPANYAALNDWSKADISKWTNEQAAWIDGNLSKEESEALRGYTGSTYGRINRLLRGTADADEIEYRERFDLLTSQIDSAMQKSFVDQDMKVYRGVNANAFRGWEDVSDGDLIGMVYNDGGFLSTSTDKDVMAGFAAHNGGYNLTILMTEGQRAVYVESVSDYSSEREMIIDRGSSYRVLEATTDSKGIRQLTVELLQDV